MKNRQFMIFLNSLFFEEIFLTQPLKCSRERERERERERRVCGGELSTLDAKAHGSSKSSVNDGFWKNHKAQETENHTIETEFAQ